VKVRIKLESWNWAELGKQIMEKFKYEILYFVGNRQLDKLEI
jgi:hypothetical protein